MSLITTYQTFALVKPTCSKPQPIIIIINHDPNGKRKKENIQNLDERPKLYAQSNEMWGFANIIVFNC